MKRILLAGLAVLSLSFWVLAFPGQSQAAGAYSTPLLQRISINLPVEPIRQSEVTSCGEAVIAMAYDYAYPKTAIDEYAIINYAEMQGYYTEYDMPFTSPDNMVKITRHYTEGFSTGTVSDPDQGLALLISELQRGAPVMIDVTTRLDDPHSSAHFVLVTGIAGASDNKYAIAIFYIDPLTGKNSVSPWFGAGGIWNAWQNNEDPGGSGWWLSIPPAPF